MPVTVTDFPGKYLVQEQKGLDQYPMPQLLKWFLRWVYDHYGFAATAHDGKQYCNVQEVGVFDDEQDADWEARHRPEWVTPSVKWIPYNYANPAETVKVGTYNYPRSEAAAWYRARRLPFTAVPTSEIEQLNASLNRSQEGV